MRRGDEFSLPIRNRCFNRFLDPSRRPVVAEAPRRFFIIPGCVSTQGLGFSLLQRALYHSDPPARAELRML